MGKCVDFKISDAEKLNFEKELLGFYLTQHPMAAALKTISQTVSTKLFEIPELPAGKTITIGGIVSKVRKIFTRRGNKEMAFVSLYDETGSAEVIVFPGIFADSKQILVEDKPLLLTVKTDEKEEQISLLAEKITPITNTTKITEEAVSITIPRGTSKQSLLKISKLLKANPGTTQIIISIKNGDQDPKKIILPFKVDYSTKLKKEISNILS